MASEFEEFWAAESIGLDFLSEQVFKAVAYKAWQAAQPQWQPIETASRDGSFLFLTNGKDIQKGFFATDSKRVFSESHVGGWVVEELIYNYDATHWMSLPSLPQQ